MTLGRNPRAVMPVESLRSRLLEAHTLHFMTTFEAHQKLATLSSKRPRAKGNIRLIGCRIADGEANGGSQGMNSTVKVDTVTIARLMNSFALIGTPDELLWIRIKS